MHHTVAYSESIATAVEDDLAPVPDQIMPIFNNHFMPPEPLDLWYVAAMGTNLLRARIVTPSLRFPSTPYIRPIISALVPNDPLRFANYFNNPLKLRATEEIQIMATQNAGANQQITAVLGLGVRYIPPPVGNIISMRGTSTTALVVNTWTPIVVTWADTIPEGRYAVIGLEHQSTNTQAARLAILGQYWRPGALTTPTIGAFGSDFMRRGGMGVWGEFNANYLPTIEVLGNVADAAHEIYLHFVRISGPSLAM